MSLLSFLSSLIVLILQKINTNNPAKKKRIPAKIIFPPTSLPSISNCWYPSLINGYANDQPNAQKNASIDLYLLFLNMFSMLLYHYLNLFSFYFQSPMGCFV